MEKHRFFMELAYQQALKAYQKDEVPIGAVLVDKDGNVIARGYNQVEKKITQVEHAEILALKKAAQKIGDWRLDGMTLYVTVQPCMMCLGAIYLSRISKVVYGVISPKYGFDIDVKKISGIYQNLHMKIEYIHYIQSEKLLQKFFEKKRRSHEIKQSRS
ncbi:nucleoside deaminase [Candidatus Dependentiae bacterium]|nr:nucleoside deaminase [Candidatus Dependentiae bacterium]